MPDTHAWATLPEQPILEAGITVLAFLLGVRLARWSGNNPFLNPTLIAIVLVVVAINVTGVPYATYLRGAGFIQFLLAPAVVLLAVDRHPRRTRRSPAPKHLKNFVFGS